MWLSQLDKNHLMHCCAMPSSLNRTWIVPVLGKWKWRCELVDGHSIAIKWGYTRYGLADTPLGDLSSYSVLVSSRV